MGYFHDQEGIMRRYLRERNLWKEHLNLTKSFIERNAAGEEKNKVAILGSGWLLDVPVEYLSKNFNEVWLFDIKHPVQVKKRLAAYRNIHFLETDLSGLAIPLYHEIKAAKRTNSNLNTSILTPIYDFDLTSFDLVISCNLLNQLDIILIDYILKHRKLTDTSMRQIRTMVQDNHIKSLPSGKSLLISDVTELLINKESEVQNKIGLIYTTMLPMPSEKWIWHFDNHFLYHNRYKTWFEVHAYSL